MNHLPFRVRAVCQVPLELNFGKSLALRQALHAAATQVPWL